MAATVLERPTQLALPQHQLLPPDYSPRIYLGDALELYASWPSPVAIISDGAYGVRGFPGDPPTAEGLPSWYASHIKAWSLYATPQTTLWFWNTEIGWATVHPLLVANGWEFRNCHIWNKSLAHVAGNSNTKTLRKFPIVTEVCVQYVRVATIPANGIELPLKQWLRHEWERSGLPFSQSNEACGVKNAATRKYLTKDHLWYFPPADAFDGLVAYANKFGAADGRPYFSRDGIRPMTGDEWSQMRAKFYCQVGISNVWDEPSIHGNERIKNNGKNTFLHGNQKPLKLIDRIIMASTDKHDVVWEPFGGLCSVAVSALHLNRQCFSAELNPAFYQAAIHRIGSNGGLCS